MLEPDVVRAAVEAIPAAYLYDQRWFAGKSLRVSRIDLRDWAELPMDGPGVILALIDVTLDGHGHDCYLLPLSLSARTPAGPSQLRPEDGLSRPDFCLALVRQIAAGSVLRAAHGTFHFTRLQDLAPDSLPPSTLLTGEQSNSSAVFGDKLILKMFRRLEDGINPDLEVNRFLTRQAFAHVGQLAGFLEYRGDDRFQASVGLLQRFVKNDGDGWTATLKHLRELDQEALSRPDPLESARRFSARYFERITVLGGITAQLHEALSGDCGDAAFAPEPLTPAEIEDWSERASRRMASTIGFIAASRDTCDHKIREQMSVVAGRLTQLRSMLSRLASLPLSDVCKIRIHGDYHLGQVLTTGRDFTILDFEGEPMRPLAERRAKHLAAKDIAGMLRSFDYAAETASRRSPAPDMLRPIHAEWLRHIRRHFLDGYFAAAKGEGFMPRRRRVAEQAIAIFELDKACYELDYEANNRPEWMSIPLSYLVSVDPST